MLISNSVQFRYFRPLEEVAVYANCQVNEFDLLILTQAQKLLVSHPDYANKRKTRADIIFVDEQIEMSFEDVVGQSLNLAIINYRKFAELPEIKKVVVYLEELVHHFWDTKDEIEVSKIVCEMLPDRVDYDRETGNYIFQEPTGA